MSNSMESRESSLPALPPGTRVAVTGGTGFIGSRLVEQLARGGAEVTCLIRGTDAGTRLHRAGARIRRLDLADADAVHSALQGIDAVFHLAYDWGDTAWNFAALRSLIKACRANDCRRLVHVSSFVVYDIPDAGRVTEDTPDTPATSGYAHTKLTLETELLAAVRESGVPGTIVQPTIVYGPYSKPWTLDPVDMLKYGTVILPDGGEGACNAVYVDDVVTAMILVAQKPEAVGQRYLVSGPAPITWRTFYEGMARAAGAGGPQLRPAEALARANSRAGQIKRIAMDPELVVRRIAGIGPARKLVTAALKVLPRGMRQTLHQRLFAPAQKRRGHIHFPDSGRLAFLQGRATIDPAKARKELGYAPAFDFERGMIPTTQYLRDIYLKVD